MKWIQHYVILSVIHRSVTPTAAAQWVTLDQYEVMTQILKDANC